MPQAMQGQWTRDELKNRLDGLGRQLETARESGDDARIATIQQEMSGLQGRLDRGEYVGGGNHNLDNTGGGPSDGERA